MNEKAKQMLILFAGAVVISGVITLQVTRSRPAPPIIGTQTEAPQETATTAPPPLTPLPVGAAPVATDLAPAPAIVGAAAAPLEMTQLAPGQWGRNPFLTLSEIAALAPQPLIPAIINLPEPILAPLPELARALPEYTVSVIVSGEEGAWAVVESRVVRTGDRLGEEIVSQINEQGVVLERAGETRQVRINRPNTLVPR